MGVCLETFFVCVSTIENDNMKLKLNLELPSLARMNFGEGSKFPTHELTTYQVEDY